MGNKRKNEVAPGISRTQVIIYGGSAALVYILIMVVLIGVGTNRRAVFGSTQEAIFGDQTRVAQIATDARERELAGTATEAFGLTQTATLAGTATATRPVFPTFPPTWTPVVVEEIDDSVPTATPLALPPDELAGGLIIGYGGIERLQNGFLPLLAFPLNDPGSFSEIGNRLVTSAAVNPASGLSLVYTRYYTTDFNWGLERANLNGSQNQRVADAWQGIEFIIRQEDIQFSQDGTKIVFIGNSEDTLSKEVWILDLVNFVPGVSPLTRVTNDASNYDSPSLSPDNSEVIAIKINERSLEPGEDIVLIEVGSGRQTQITEDGPAQIESQLAWLPNNPDEIAYVVRGNGGEEPGDIIRLNIRDRGVPALYLVRDTNGWDDTHPVFSPDGNFMAYASDRTGTHNIFIRDLRTSIDFQLTNESFDPYFPDAWYQPDVIEPIQEVNPLPTPFLTPTPEPSN